MQGKITDYLNKTSSGASSEPRRTRRARHQQDQQQQQQQGQQHDVRRMLELALFNLSRAQLGAIGSDLHPTSRAHRSLALSALPHLSLQRFDDEEYPTCEAVYQGRLVHGCFARAVQPKPPIPWGTLGALQAAGGHLESLHIRQCQAQPLMAGSRKAATAPVLAATLAGLRCLHVTELAHEEGDDMYDHFRGDWPEESYKTVQLQRVGDLIRSCSGLTKLVLETADHHHGADTYYLRGISAAEEDEEEDSFSSSGEEEEEEEEMEQQHGEEEEEAAVTGRGGPWLPQLRRLEVEGFMRGVLPTLLGARGSPHLTSCSITSQEVMEEEDFDSLAACSKLQELELSYGFQIDLEANLQRLLPSCTALTKLVLDSCGVEEDMLCAVCVATQLRHLDVGRNHWLLVLPPALSSLQHLTFLDINGTGVVELPQQLGKWLPQLQVLGMEDTKVAAIPSSLQRLTSLRAADSGVTSAAAVEEH